MAQTSRDDKLCDEPGLGPRASHVDGAAPAHAASPSQAQRRKRTARRVLAVLALLLLLGGIVLGGLYLWSLRGVGVDPGTTIAASSEGMSDEEIQEMLNRQMEESMMSVSIATKVKLHDGKLYIYATNSEDNKVAQVFTVLQDGKQVVQSGAVMPGKKLDTVDAKGAKAGEATIRVQAVEKDSLDAYGNPSEFTVDIVEE